MGIAQIPAPSGGLAVARFPAASNVPFNVPAGLTLQNTVTSTTTFSAGQLPAQVWAVIVGAGGSGSANSTNYSNGGGGGGGVVIGWVDVPSAGITATIGAGGTAVTNASGNRGGTTYFGAVFASGGGGGCNQGSSILDTNNAMPLQGEGVPGWGGSGTTTYQANSYNPLIVGAPWGTVKGTWSVNSAASTINVNGNLLVSNRLNNYLGGGAGGFTSTGGSGYTGGGGANGNSGGNSSRDGGLTNTFTGGTNGGANGGGGGAGFLANGNNGTAGNVGGAGGSGGGGGGNSGAGFASGAGGAGCVLIYY